MFSSKEEVSHTYNAKFGDASEYLSSFNEGFAIVGNKAITKSLSYENCFLCGPTGSGKSSVVIFSSLVNLSKGKSSIIINDVSGELWKTSAYLARQGYTILRFDASDSTNSETFNPLLLCKTISDINKLALIVVRNAIGQTKGDPFWENSSIMLIALMSRYLVFHTEEKYRTLQNVLRLIEKFAVDGKSVDKLFIRTKNESIIDAYKATLVIGGKTIQAIIASARTALQLFVDIEVCKVTASNSIDFKLLREKPVALYVCNPLKDLKYFKPLASLFFQSLFDFIVSRIPGKDERSIFILIDEFASMRFPDIALTVSNIRKCKAGLLLCMQDEMSLKSQYGEAEAHQIKSNCSTQVYMKGLPLNSCKDLSQILGRYTIIDEEGKEHGARNLMEPDEIRMCDEAIVLINNKPPLKCRTMSYFENIWMGGLTKKGSYKPVRKVISEPCLIAFE